MDRSRPSAYEPFRHAKIGSADDEKPLVPPAAPSTASHSQQHAALPRGVNGRHAKNGGGGALDKFRTALRVLVLIIAATIVGLQAHALAVWKDTRDDVVDQRPDGGQWRMQSWAVMDFTPTWTTLGVAAASVVVQTIALISICTWLNKIRNSLWHVLSVYLTSVLFIAAWIAALVYFRIDYSQGEQKSRWDMWAYTCQNKAKTGGTIPWNVLCIQMEYTWIAEIVAAAAELLGLVLFIVSRRHAPKKYKMVKPIWKK
ncbi:hypothetical protein TWF696_000500 [Orbilia brochopaga]|uniref:Uncharacterized protein n=1 Tax=Orbilia brochopaga TaxID=3140254 RepID=A0AAV9VE76_9PEZI